MDTATTDLSDLHGNVRDGMHVASCGGTWMAIVYGFAGLRDDDGQLVFRPALPPHWERLRFRLRVRGAQLEVELKQRQANYRLLSGGPLAFDHRKEHIVLSTGEERRVDDPDMAPQAWTMSQTAIAASGAHLPSSASS
jgi:alpha,alpha-trehalose phosphorylase